MTYRVLFAFVSLSIMLATCSTPKLEFPPDSMRPHVVETPRIPFTDWVPYPRGQHEAQLRKIRDVSYNKGSREYLFVGLRVQSIVDRVDIARDFVGSSTVVLATVEQAQSRLSGDHQNLYTEWIARVEEVWEQAEPPDLKLGAELLINRVGRAIRMPTGEKFETTVEGLSGPLYTEGKYVLFLHYRPKQGL